MNYKHAFHAGHFTDVVKHLVYIYSIDYFKKKEKPLFLLDTHGGAGRYNLRSQAAQKTKEASTGILKIVKANSTNQLIMRYKELLHSYLIQDHYPGSPIIAATLLREYDTLRVTELNPKVYPFLKQEMDWFENVHVTLQDGYEALKAYLPPKENRGIILIDPAYEAENEFDSCAQAIVDIYPHFMNGTYLIWYPIKEEKKVYQFLKKIDILPCEKLTVTASLIDDPKNDKLKTAGILVLNPPYLLKETLEELAPELERILQVNLECQMI